MADKKLWCNFCGKESADVAMLVVGPDCAICNECVVVCAEMINKNLLAGHLEYESWAERYDIGSSPDAS